MLVTILPLKEIIFQMKHLKLLKRNVWYKSINHNLMQFLNKELVQLVVSPMLRQTNYLLDLIIITIESWSQEMKFKWELGERITHLKQRLVQLLEHKMKYPKLTLKNRKLRKQMKDWKY